MNVTNSFKQKRISREKGFEPKNNSPFRIAKEKLNWEGYRGSG